MPDDLEDVAPEHILAFGEARAPNARRTGTSDRHARQPTARAALLPVARGRLAALRRRPSQHQPVTSASCARVSSRPPDLAGSGRRRRAPGRGARTRSTAVRRQRWPHANSSGTSGTRICASPGSPSTSCGLFQSGN